MAQANVYTTVSNAVWYTDKCEIVTGNTAVTYNTYVMQAGNPTVGILGTVTTSSNVMVSTNASQGLIGSTPKNKIIYEALKDMYHITKETLKDYFIIVKHLYPIVQKYKKDYHVKLYVEKWHVKPSKKKKCQSVILEDKTKIPLLMHF